MADRTLRIDIQVDDKGAVQAIKRVDDALDQAGAAAKGVSPYIDRINVLAQQFGGSKLTTEARAVAQAVAELGGASKLTANEQVRINALMTEAAAKYKALGQAVPGLIVDTQKMTAATAQIGPAATTAATGMTTLKQVAGALGLMFGAGALVLGVKRFIGDMFSLADSLTKLQSQTGIGIEALQDLSTVAMRGGTDVDSLARAINMMQKRIAGEDESAVAALRILKINLDTLRAMAPEQQFYTISQAINAVDDASARTKLRVDIMGRGASEVADAMVQDFEAARQATVRLSAGTVIALDVAGEKLQLWGSNLKKYMMAGIVAFFDQAARLGDLALVAIDRMLAGFYSKMGAMLGWLAKVPVVSPGMSGLLAGASAAAAEQARWYTDAAKAVTAAMEREAVAALKAAAETHGAAAGLVDFSKAAKTTARAAKESAETLSVASRALSVSQLSKLPDVTGWPGLTEWAKAQPGLESTDLSGMLYNLPGAYLGNMQAGQLIVKRQTEDFAKIFNASLDDLSRAFAELAQVADGDMAKAVRAIGTVISTMRIASQAAASTREILWNAETGTWQAPQGAGQYAQLAANTVAMYAAMQQATGSTSRVQNIWSGAGTGAQIGGGIVPGWGHLIGAGLGALWGGLSRAPEQAAKDLRDAFVSAAGGLAALNAKAAAAGIALQGLLSQTDVEGVQWHIDDINRRLGEFAKRLQDAALPLARIGAAGGLLGPYEIRALVRDATQPEVRAALEAFFVSETQRGIKGLTQWTGALRLDELRAARQALTAAETRGVISEIEAAETKLSEIQAAIRQGISAATAPGLTGATVAYWRGLEAQGLSLVEILDALGPQITAIQEGFTLAGISGGAAFDAIARVVMATADPAVRSILETVTGINAVLETLFNMGRLTQETFGGLLAGVMEQYEELIRLGQAPEEARRLLRQPLQTIWQLQQTYRFTVDEATQRLLDEALAAKEVGETFRPAADRMVAAIDNLIAKLQGFIDVLLGVSGADEPPPAPPELPPKIAPREPSPWYGEPWPELPPLEGDPFGHAGGLVTPQGIKRWHTGGLASDEVPAILQMGELILSRRETQVLGRLAAGGSALTPAALECAVRAGMLAAMREQKPPVVNLDGRQVSRPLVRRIPDVLASYGRR